MRIAILGWGSLLWEEGHEFDKWHGPWKSNGPILNIEFSRISESRMGALTLVIDLDDGIPTTVAWCVSRRQKAEDAICDLRCREGTTIENIGQLFIASRGEKRTNLPKDAIVTWARKKKLDVIVWTALRSNFPEKAGKPFSLEAVISYVKTLPPEGKAKAAEYIWRAPAFVQTPVRFALQQEPWFPIAAASPSLHRTRRKAARWRVGR